MLQKEKDFSNPDRKSDIEHTLPPNVCISVYKNRGGKYNNIKIWLYIDYDTMRIHDRFVTNYDYKTFKDGALELEGLNGKYVYVRENENNINNNDHQKDGFILNLSDVPVEAKWNNEFPDNFLTTTAEGEIEQNIVKLKKEKEKENSLKLENSMSKKKKIKPMKVEDDLEF